MKIQMRSWDFFGRIKGYSYRVDVLKGENAVVFEYYLRGQFTLQDFTENSIVVFESFPYMVLHNSLIVTHLAEVLCLVESCDGVNFWPARRSGMGRLVKEGDRHQNKALGLHCRAIIPSSP